MRTQGPELRNLGLLLSNQISEVSLQALIFSHRYFTGDRLFAALNFRVSALLADKAKEYKSR